MLTTAISFLFAIAIVISALVIAHSLGEAKAAWERLVREGEMLRAVAAAQSAAADELRLSRRSAPAPVIALASRRPALALARPRPQQQPLGRRACAA